MHPIAYTYCMYFFLRRWIILMISCLLFYSANGEVERMKNCGKRDTCKGRKSNLLLSPNDMEQREYVMINLVFEVLILSVKIYNRMIKLTHSSQYTIIYISLPLVYIHIPTRFTCSFRSIQCFCDSNCAEYGDCCFDKGIISKKTKMNLYCVPVSNNQVLLITINYNILCENFHRNLLINYNFIVFVLNRDKEPRWYDKVKVFFQIHQFLFYLS